MAGGEHQAITQPVIRAGAPAVRPRRVQLADPVPVNTMPPPMPLRLPEAVSGTL